MERHDVVELFKKNIELAPHDVVNSLGRESFQDIANILWSMIDDGEIEITRNKTLILRKDKCDD
jgi:hypothetical protein